ncbi:hypothetical protein CCYA_CCYA03G1074 [Cyanidiococcus yangmingshanensis]|nr:hypothetical protein CCYA_CCYA03G1074 [Cyanidiococcus yangmingshanensis]
MGLWKRLEVSTSNAVRSSDVRKLRQDLLQQEGRWITEEEIELILPNSKTQSIILVKCSSPKANLFVVDKEPVLFQPARSALYFPTVYALWKVRRWPVLETTQEVSKFLLGGADLMLPGIFRDRSSTAWDVGQVFAVCVRGNPCPFAIGVTLLGSSNSDKNVKGKALSVEHFVGDALWEYGSKLVPNQGFLIGEAVLPLENEESETAERQSTQMSEEAENGNISCATNSNHAVDELGKELEEHQISDSEEAETGVSAEIDPDQLLIQSFLQALKNQPDLTLPVDASKFYVDHVVPSRPAGTTLDLKATSFKKLGGFLKAMAKRKLIKTKEQRGAILIVDVDRQHELLRSFESHQSEVPNAVETSACGVSTPRDQTIPIEEWFKPKPHQRAFFDTNALTVLSDREMNAEPPLDLFQSEQVRKILEHYVRLHGLERAPNTIEIDEDLGSCLQLPPAAHPRQLHFSELHRSLLNTMEAFHRIGRDSKLHRGRVRPIQVIVEDRQGGRKHITRIQRIGSYGIEDEQFAADVQRRFAAAATVSDVAGSAKKGGVPDTEVTLQGSFASEVVELLTNAYHIPSHLCEIVDKRKKRK